jgi:hypothetical protein
VAPKGDFADTEPVEKVTRLSQEERSAMYSMLPGEALASALEMVCYGFTVAAAVVSCLLSLRM